MCRLTRTCATLRCRGKGSFSLAHPLALRCINPGIAHKMSHTQCPVVQTRHLFTPRIAGCHISLFYYGGFCYLMSRRYLDAARTFNTVLAYIQRYAYLQPSDPLFRRLQANLTAFACVLLSKLVCAQ